MSCSRFSLRLRAFRASARHVRVRAFRAPAGRVCAAALLFSSVSAMAAGAVAPVADAAEKMDRTAIRTLVQRRADVNAPQPDGMTALHWAAYQDDLETAGLLLGAGASVKAVTRYGVTPLSLASTNGNASMVALLLKAGADPNARTLSHIWYAAYNTGRMGVEFTGATPFWRAAEVSSSQKVLSSPARST